MFHELCNIRQAEQIGGLNLLGDEFNLKHEIVVVKEISHKSNLLFCFGQNVMIKLVSYVTKSKNSWVQPMSLLLSLSHTFTILAPVELRFIPI